ncbi:hypothetical protein [Pelagibacterium sediminicola]|uniref:hypothetical protein n=1 Tax=Pelagibacterium sediminicola TaxID=2248761 RepID=UPI00130054D8|nr:hypothetical protein [Pelagibacterium sediminicola]
MNSKVNAPSGATAKPCLNIDKITDAIVAVADVRNLLSDELDVAVAHKLTTFDLKGDGKDISALVVAIDDLGSVMTALDGIHARASQRERDANAAPVKEIFQEALEKGDDADPYDTERLKADIAADPFVEERLLSGLTVRFAGKSRGRERDGQVRHLHYRAAGCDGT